MRAKLFAAIALTVIGPLVTIAVAFTAFGTLGDRFDEVERAVAAPGVALDLKFAVTDRRRVVVHPGAEAALFQLEGTYRRFMALDEEAWAALDAGDEAATKRILLGPELELFARMARIGGELASGAERSAVSARVGFDDARTTARRELVAVGIGAGIVIVLLLITVQDVVRLALERREAT